MLSLYEETIQKIKSLEIQGAESIAIAATKAFAEKLKETRNQVGLLKYYEELISIRPTEPGLRNALRYCLLNYQKNPDVAEEVLKHFQFGKEKMAEFGANKIQDGMVIFTHCHSSTVTQILLKALHDGKKFSVRCTETRPKYQGRKTAEELAKVGIPVTFSVDSSGRLQLQKSDMYLFGADAITVEGNVVNKIGTTLLSEFAYLFQIPVYSCSNTWKFSAETIFGREEVIEERAASEIWENAPPGVTIWNPAFEITPADRISGLITELGIFKPETLVLRVLKTYPWMTQALR